MILLTHKGWFGICPVYLGETFSAAPHVVPRRPLFDWLMTLSEFGLNVAGWCLQAMDNQFDPQWPIRITGKLDRPIEFYP